MDNKIANLFKKIHECNHETEENIEYEEDEDVYCIEQICKKCKLIIHTTYRNNI